MDQNEITKKQLESAKKGIEWMEVSKPSVAACEISVDASTADGSFPSGKAMCPHERHCGKSHPISGANSDDLRDWCGEHEL